VNLGVENAEEIVVASCKDEEPMIRQRRLRQPHEEPVLCDYYGCDKLLLARKSSAHSRSCLSMNPVEVPVSLALALPPQRKHVFNHMLERQLILRCIFLVHGGAKVDDPEIAGPLRDVNAIHPRPNNVTVVFAIRVPASRQHTLGNALIKLKRANFCVSHVY
jgi:hypothetical protein